MNKPRMNNFERYLTSIRRRERFRLATMSALVVVVVLAVMVLFTTFLGLERGFTENLVWIARAAAILVIVILLAILVVKPWRYLSATRGTALVEEADSAFNGRAETWLNTAAKTPDHPFLDPLADDAMRVASRVPKSKVVRTGTIGWPVIGLLAVLGAGLSFVQYANLAWKNGASHVLFGWAKTGLVVQRELNVEPGSVQLLAGEDLTIVSQLIGFTRDTVSLEVRYENGDWQSTDVSASAPDEFEFTLFRVNESFEYRVSAQYAVSETFAIDVVEPARLESIQATLTYPEWTELEARNLKNVRSVSGVKGTEVLLTFTTDKPLNNPSLLVGLNKVSVDVEENKATARVVITDNATYQLTDSLLGQDVAVSPEHSINLRGDNPPNVKFVIPGRDVSASPIEEVLIGLEARDDFGIKTIELWYSVNAEEWQSIDLGTEPLSEHVFYLESMGPDNSPLLPGDLISYYVRVTDHDQMVETDMLLVDVRPFERRFSQESSGGGGGGGGSPGNEGADISKRQKEILIATWNLFRASEAANGDTSGQRDNALLLSEMQSRLAEQAITLADRSEARSLTSQGELIREFVDYLREAVESMGPSSDALEALTFEDAIKPQQRALQLLQRAEALFNDIRINEQSGQGQGQGQQPGQDMTEMFELEMDLERNQYEQPERAPSPSEAQSEGLDDIFERLAELAKRQQELTEAERDTDRLTREERWQQEQLARELEQLQRDLEELEQQSASSSDSPSSDAGESGEQSGEQGGESREQEMASLREQLEQAQEAIQDALNNDQENPGDSGAESEDRIAGESGVQTSEAGAADRANEALQEALAELSNNRAQDLQERISAAANATESILREQRETEQAIRDAVEASAKARDLGRFSPGMSREESTSLARRKHDLQRALEDVRRDVGELQERFAQTAPETAELLDEAIDALDDSRADLMLGIAGDGIENGSFATVLPSESLVTNSVREFRDRLNEALDSAAGESINTDVEGEQVADALRQLQSIRQLLEGQQGEGQGEGQGDGQGDGQGAGQAGQRGQGGASRGSGRAVDGGGDPSASNSESTLVDAAGAREAADALESVLPSLSELGFSAEDLSDIEASIDRLRESDQGINARRIEEQFSLTLQQVEQLELALQSEGTTKSSASGLGVERSVSETAADYFRRLSEQ